jgi:hypothetical protein
MSHYNDYQGTFYQLYSSLLNPIFQALLLISFPNSLQYYLLILLFIFQHFRQRRKILSIVHLESQSFYLFLKYFLSQYCILLFNYFFQWCFTTLISVHHFHFNLKFQECFQNFFSILSLF